MADKTQPFLHGLLKKLLDIGDGCHAEVVAAKAVPFSDDGAYAYTHNADGTRATVSKTIGGVTKTRTYSYTAGKLVGISDWV